MSPHPKYKAVLFDLGGVVLGSPVGGIYEYERKVGLPAVINFCIFSKGKDGAFQKLERGELKVGAKFYKLFEEDIADPENVVKFKEYLKARGRPIPANLPDRIVINGEEMWKTMMGNSATANEDMIKCIHRLRAAGFRVGALTNNFKDEPEAAKSDPSLLTHREKAEPRHKMSDGLAFDLPSIFDKFVESSVIGHRKPEPKAFAIACDELGVRPEEVVFLDDIGTNLKGAKQVGMTTI
ncbi:epoxide hydrolase, partial [Hyaloraphidium curvatum]